MRSPKPARAENPLGNTRRSAKAYLYLLPAFAVLAVFVVYPILMTLRMGFYQSYVYLTDTGTGFGLNGEDFNWYLLFVALVASFFFHRFWCHVFCPAGALLDFVASKRRDAGKKLCGKKKCPSGAKCGAACPSGGATRASGGSEAATKAVVKDGTNAPRRPTKAQMLFLILYAAGAFCIVWTVWANVNAH